jgi:hypothetical protein
VAHLAEGTLRRIYDDPDAKTGADALHLDSCAECQARLRSVSEDAVAVGALLAVPDAKVDVARAFSKLGSAPAARSALRMPFMRSGSRPFVLAFAAAIAALALVVTAVAQGGFSSTPSTVVPVPITVADMQALSQLGDYGTVTWTTQPKLQVLTSADEASNAAGFPLPKDVALPAGVSSIVTYVAISKGVGTFTFSADKAAAAATKNGKTMPALPAKMNGATVTITLGPAAGKVYGQMTQAPKGSDITQANLPQMVIGKSVSPTVTSDQVSPKEFQDYLLAQPGISPELRDAIKALGSSGTAMPIPVPVQFATHESVTLTGNVQAVALGDNTGLGSGVVWIKGGYVYAVGGTIKKSDAINIANNLI